MHCFKSCWTTLSAWDQPPASSLRVVCRKMLSDIIDQFLRRCFYTRCHDLSQQSSEVLLPVVGKHRFAGAVQKRGTDISRYCVEELDELYDQWVKTEQK